MYDLPEYYRGPDDVEAIRHHHFANKLHHQMSFGPSFHPSRHPQEAEEVNSSETPSKKETNAHSVQKIVTGKIEKSEKSASNEEHSVKKEIKTGGMLHGRLGSASDARNSANKTIYNIQHQQSPPEQITYMNGFKVPESPLNPNMLKKINALRSPYMGMTVSGSKSHDSPRMMKFAKPYTRSVNSNKNFDSGSPTNEQNPYYGHMPSYPAYPYSAYEDFHNY